MQQKILIIGGSSVIGSHLISYLWDKARLVATYNATPMKLHGVVAMPLDLTNKDAAEKVIQVIKPDVVIYCASMTGVKQCQVSGKLTEHLNNAAPVSISYACEKRKIKFVFLSSCYIFSGETGNYKENENPRAITLGGGGTMAAEYSIQKNSSNYLIIRVPPIFGRSISANKVSLLEYIEMNLFHNKSIELDNRIKTNYLSGFILAKMVDACLNMEISNRILHVGSPDVMTRYDFGMLVANTLKKSPDLISGKVQEFMVDENRAQFIETKHQFTLDVENAQALFRTAIPTVEAQLQNYYQMQWLDLDKNKVSVKTSSFL